MKRPLSLGLVLLLLTLGASLHAAIAPQGDPVATRATGHPDLFPRGIHTPVADLPLTLAAALAPNLSALGVSSDLAAYDVRAGRWGSLILSVPLVPGSGTGNTLTWSALGLTPPTTDAQYRAAVWSAFRAYLQKHGARLGIADSELGAPSIGTYENNRLAHIYAGRVFKGVPVRETFVRATLNSGNLILYATRNWGTIGISTTPAVSADAAIGAVRNHLSGFNVTRVGTPQLVIVPLASGRDAYAYRLAWSISATVAGSDGSWEALVDAATGELLGFYDRNSYIDQKKVVGGIFPVSNDGRTTNGVPDGIEQPGYPMGRAYVFQGATQFIANSEGLVTIPGGGEYRTSLTGPYVRIQDQCGAVNETSRCDKLDLGTSDGTDCARPANHSLGDTHSARTGFFELNRLIDQAKTWAGIGGVSSLWMNRQLPSNMNINNACNAFFNPADTANPTTGSINFYRNGALGSNVCRNTGEIPAVFDHEWGHGLDTFDDSPGVSLPGEAYADMTAILRLNSSCVARGFYLNNSTGGQCGGNGDVCLDCSGVREVDWMKRASKLPHDLAWVLDQNPTVPGNCGAMLVPATPFNSGPCQRSTHCEGTIISEAFWDLLKRDLPCHGKGWEAPSPNGTGPVGGGQCKAVAGSASPTLDENSALVLTTRLFYLASPGVVMGYQCDQVPNGGGPRNGGCNADSWYMNVLAADDDDGNLANGTPHMVAIETAFRRHGISCRVPVPLNLGCLATPAPTAKPVVTATAGVRSATVEWTAVPGATEYWILRTDGVYGCNFGKTRVGRVAATAPRTFTQTDLLDGFTYYYSVVAVGGVAAANIVAEACAGPMSECASVTPAAPDGLDEACPAPDNRAPLAVDDAMSAPRNHSRTFRIESNDSDADNDALIVSSITAATFGSVVLNADGSVTFTPPAGAAIGDRAEFDYIVADGRGGTDSGHVVITVGGDPCRDPGGFAVLTDPAGDAASGAQHDVQSASIAQTADGKFIFMLKMASLGPLLPPDTTWPLAYSGADGAVRFVKMANMTSVCPTGVCFARGAGSEPSVAGVPADPSSSWSADGTIRIVVPGSAIGNPQPGQQFTAFLSRIRLEVPGVGALLPDNMPNDSIATGSYEVVSCTP